MQYFRFIDGKENIAVIAADSRKTPRTQVVSHQYREEYATAINKWQLYNGEGEAILFICTGTFAETLPR